MEWHRAIARNVERSVAHAPNSAKRAFNPIARRARLACSTGTGIDMQIRGPCVRRSTSAALGERGRALFTSCRPGGTGVRKNTGGSDAQVRDQRVCLAYHDRRQAGRRERAQRRQCAVVARVGVVRMRAVARMSAVVVSVAGMLRCRHAWHRDAVDLADAGHRYTAHLRRARRQQWHTGAQNERADSSPYCDA